MNTQPHGELIPVGGGDNIPLLRTPLSIGRRDSCDIPLRLPNVSGIHCELVFRDGFWWIHDLKSTNGIKVNGTRVPKKILRSGDTITIAKRSFTIEYNPPAAAQHAIEEMLEEEDIMGQSLLEKAGLARPRSQPRRGAQE